MSAAKQTNNQVEYCRLLYWLTERLVAGDITGRTGPYQLQYRVWSIPDRLANGRRCVRRELRLRMPMRQCWSRGLVMATYFVWDGGNNGDGIELDEREDHAGRSDALASANGDVIRWRTRTPATTRWHCRYDMDRAEQHSIVSVDNDNADPDSHGDSGS